MRLSATACHRLRIIFSTIRPGVRVASIRYFSRIYDITTSALQRIFYTNMRTSCAAARTPRAPIPPSLTSEQQKEEEEKKKIQR